MSVTLALTCQSSGTLKRMLPRVKACLAYLHGLIRKQICDDKQPDLTDPI